MASAGTRAFDDRTPSPSEIDSANRLRTILANQIRPGEPTKFRLAADKGQPADVVLAPELARVFLDLLRYVGSGLAVTLVPTQHMLTTQQAADLLNISRPHLIKLLEQGKCLSRPLAVTDASARGPYSTTGTSVMRNGRLPSRDWPNSMRT